MINECRMAFQQGSGGQIAHDFPFESVQVYWCHHLNLYNGHERVDKIQIQTQNSADLNLDVEF